MSLDVFDLWAKIGFDSSEYDRGLDEAEKRANGFGDKLGSVFGAAAKAIAAATAAAATGAAALVKQSVDAYANQEQLIGGVETLFSNLEGTVSAAPTVLENAANAYKTAGMSANEYMETVTSFSAALVSSLNNDYDEAARVSDMAITDMADNANKMGTSLESIQNAYQGFSKQNYTMLDNLKLGYGGTKSEMERLLADAEKFSGVKYDISNLSDVYNAIHVIQQEMSIAGTTAKEANDTITGSMGQLSGAWTNLVAGFADSQADIPALIDNVVEVAEVSFGNLLPTVEKAIGGVAEFVEDIAPIVVEKLPDVVEQVVPPLLNAADTIVGALVDTLPTLLGAVVDVVPGIVTDMSQKVIEIMPQIADLGLTFVKSLARGVADNAPVLITAAVDAVHDMALKLANRDTLRDIIDAGLDLVVALADGVAENISTLAETAEFIIGSVADYLTSEDFFPKLRDAGEDILKALGEGMEEHFPIIGGLITDLADNFDGLVTVVETAAVAFGAYQAAAAISGVVDTLRNSVQLLTTAQWGLNAAMDANVFGLVAAGIAGAAYLISQSVTAIKPAGENIEEITGKIDAVAESAKETLRDLDNLTEAQRRVIADDLTESIEQAKVDLTEATAQISEGFFRYRDDVLGESDNAIRAFAEQYKDVVEDVNGEGFVFTFDDTEDIDYVQQALSDLMTAIQSTGEDVGELSTMYTSIYDASTQLKDAADNIDVLINAQKRIANYNPNVAKFIPTEALRQMEGKAAPTITRIGEEIENVGDKSDDTGDKFDDMGDKAEETGKKIKEALTFDTKAIGDYRNLGVVEVLGKALTEEEENAKKIADTVFSASQQYVERQTNTLDLSLQEQIEMWESVQAQFVEGSEQYLKAGDKIVALQKKQATELANEAKKTADAQKKAYDDRVKAIENYQKQVDKIYSEIEDIEQKYTDALAERTNDIYDSFGLFEKVPDRVLYSGQDLIANVQGQVATLQKWFDDLAKLEARGVDQDTIAELRSMGVGSADYIDALLDLNQTDLNTWVAAVNEKRQLAADTATDELSDMAVDTANQVNAKLGEAADLTKQTAKDLGMSISEMIAEGITDGADIIAKATQSVLDVTGIDISDVYSDAWKTSDSNKNVENKNQQYDSAVAQNNVDSTALFGKDASAAVATNTVSTADTTSSDSTAQDAATTSQASKITQKITININGVQYQSLNELTQAISEELQKIMSREVSYA